MKHLTNLTDARGLTIEDLLNVMRSIPKVPRVVPSEWVARGTAYHVPALKTWFHQSEEFILVNADDFKESFEGK